MRCQTISELKQIYKKNSLGNICELFGITRQAYYQYLKKEDKNMEKEMFIISNVLKIREYHPRIGGRKLYYMLRPILRKKRIKIGRDKFFDILSRSNLLIKNRKRSIKTTYSSHWQKKHANKIKGIQVHRKNQLWVSDITYFKVNEVFVFISFIVDVYSKKILGYSIEENLSTKGPLKALKMALENLGENDRLVHHSDRGIQYCSNEYTSLLMENKIEISMTESGDPIDNAIAERVNGTIKNEYMKYKEIKNLKQAKKVLDESVNLYNK